MPIKGDARKMLKAMVKQYCTGKTRDTTIDTKTDGIPTCRKARQVFYAWGSKHGVKLSLSTEELMDLTIDCLKKESEED